MSTDAGHFPLNRSGVGGGRGAPRLSRFGTVAVAVAAETRFGFLLVVRHRTPRLALGFAFTMLALVMFGDGQSRAGPEVALLVAGTVSAIVGARVLAAGPALTSVRRIAPPLWVVTTGRLVGACAVAVPLAWIGAWCVGTQFGTVYVMQLGLVASMHALATATVVLAATPVVGASGSALLGLIMVWAGGLRPSMVDGLLTLWPLIRSPVVLLWNALPLLWRAQLWLEQADPRHLMLLVAWIFGGVGVTIWTAGLVGDDRHGGAP